MFDLNRELGIKSFSFRDIKDIRELGKAIRRCGADRVDISGCHVDYDNPGAQQAAISALAEEGVKIVGNGVVNFSADMASNRRYFEFARRAGAGVISFSLPPQDHLKILQQAQQLCDEFNLRCAIHNHGGYDWLGNSRILQYLLGQTSNRIGLCLDTAWCIQSGEDPLKWLELFGTRLYAIHFKDFVFDRVGKHNDVVVGTGALNLPAFLAQLGKLNFCGPAVVEYEGPSPEAPSQQCVQEIRRCLTGIA